jgi:hypothetical protein
LRALLQALLADFFVAPFTGDKVGLGAVAAKRFIAPGALDFLHILVLALGLAKILAAGPTDPFVMGTIIAHRFRACVA